MKKGDFETAVILLNHSQCNPNIQDLTGNTPLHMQMATSEVSLSNIESFLNHKSINVSIQNREGDTPLHEAVMRQAPACVVEALTHHNSCNPNIVNNVGMTPLQTSGHIEDVDSAEVLITSGKCSHQDIVMVSESTLLLHQAVLSNRPKLALGIINVQECDINKTSSVGETALHVACKTSCSIAALKKLVEDSRCDLNAQDQHGNTALHLAAGSISDSAKKVKCITQSNRCNPNISNRDGHTPLHFALITNEVQSAENLLKHLKCNPNIQDLRGNTPLHMALTGNISLSNVQPLLNHKDIDLSIQNKEGNTPLHEAVMRQVPVDVMEALTLHKSCNPSIANNERMTPLQISECDYAQILINSKKCSHKDIIMATEGMSLHQAVSSKHVKQFLALLCIPRCNVNVTNSEGKTAFHIACGTNYNKVILERLVEDSRCDLNAQDQHGNTALHLAIYSEQEVAKKVQCILQSERCNPNITNSKGYTPLHEGVVRGIPVNVLTVLVLHSSCNLSIANAEGMTPLQIAVDIQQMETATILIASKKCSHEDIVQASKDASLLIHSVFSDDVELLTTLIDAGVDISISNSKGETALHAACKEGNIKATELLLQSRADVLAVDCDGIYVHVQCTGICICCVYDPWPICCNYTHVNCNGISQS